MRRARRPRPGPRLDIEVVRPSALDPAVRHAWRRLRATRPATASPFFDPGYVEAIAAGFAGTRVALVRASGALAGVFAFDVGDDRRAVPIGGTLTDWQGVVAAPGLALDPNTLLSRCRLVSWRFDHLAADDPVFGACGYPTGASPQIDLTDGRESYEASLAARGSSVVTKLAAAQRRLERERGPVEVCFDDRDPEALRLLQRWKSAQYRASGAVDLFGSPLVRDALDALRSLDEPGCRAVLSTLRAGGEVVAAHLGLASETVLHYWLPAYDPAAHASSPGQVLLLELARQASGRGITTIDLGKGDADYKRRFATHEAPLRAGRAERPSWRTAARQVRARARR